MLKHVVIGDENIQLNSNILNMTARELNWNKNKHIIMTETQNTKYSANNFISTDCYFDNY